MTATESTKEVGPPLATVMIRTYNQVRFIGKALEGAVMQQTTFPFEVIVHDDASTDGTSDIVREYAQRYPGIVIADIEKENQYSKGNYSGMNVMPRGRYLAICEGDDYWCKEDKLQKQVDYLEKHPECSYVFSNAYDVDVDGNITGERINTDVDRVFSAEEMIRGFHVFPTTASVVTRIADMMDFPSSLLAGEVGDEPIRDFLMTRGNAFCFADKTCCYRRMSPGSWSERFMGSLAFQVRQDKAYCDFYKRFDQFSEGRFHEILQDKIAEHDRVSCVRTIHLTKLKRVYVDYFNSLSGKTRMLLYVKYYLPFVLTLGRCLRYGFKKGIEGNELQHSFFKDHFGKMCDDAEQQAAA